MYGPYAHHFKATMGDTSEQASNGGDGDEVQGDEVVQERVQNWVCVLCVRQKHGVLFRLH